MSDKKRKTAVVLLVIAGCAAMAFVESVVRPGYAVKSMVKMAVFLGLPAGYSFLDPKARLTDLCRLRAKGILHAALLGAATYVFILACYFLLGSFFDLSSITDALTRNLGIDAGNFLFVALYISFINSLLEEFFFRGFAFLTLRKTVGRAFAYLFSAGVFALYHITMMTGWFSAGLYVMLIACLFLAGLFFDRLDEKGGNIYPSWAVHMFANFAINTIGFILFGII